MVAFQEIVLNFNYAGVEGQWKNRFGWNRWLDSHRVKTVKLTPGTPLIKQYGGVGILAVGRTCFYVADPGIDPSELGRWYWTRYKGKDETDLPSHHFLLSSQWRLLW